jgi:pimeloyl-ACP methyl ester carboxylesterase
VRDINSASKELTMKALVAISFSFLLLDLATPMAPGQCLRRPAGGNGPTNGLTFLVIADGAGAYSTLANNAQDAVYDLPLNPCNRPLVRPIEWSTGNELLDYRSRTLHLMGASRMVAEVQRIRKASPDSPIVLLGFSAGASVVMFAAEQLPANTVDLIILLSPTVASCYDVRPALRASKLGIDSFYVPSDGWLGQIEAKYGAPYGPPHSTVAGSTGFLMVRHQAFLKDPLLCKVREHRFPDLQGGHFGTVRPNFLKCCVAPLIPYGVLTPLPCTTSAPPLKDSLDKQK